MQATLMRQTELLHTSTELVRHHLEREESHLSSLDEAALNIRPSTGWWSVGQIAEHLVVTHRLYFDEMEEAVAKSPKRASADAEHRPTFFGKFLVKNVGPGANSPAPRIFWPSEHPPVDIMATLKSDHQRLMDMINRSADLDLNAVKMPSPVSKLIKMNLGDSLLMHAIHGERHIQQMLELLAVQPD